MLLSQVNLIFLVTTEYPEQPVAQAKKPMCVSIQFSRRTPLPPIPRKQVVKKEVEAFENGDADCQQQQTLLNVTAAISAQCNENVSAPFKESFQAALYNVEEINNLMELVAFADGADMNNGM